MQTWLEVYGADFKGQWIRWQEDGIDVAGCLLVTRVIRMRWLVPLRTVFVNATGEALERTPLAEFNDVLCVPGHEEAVIDDLASLLGEMSWDRLLLSGYEDGSILARLVARLPTALVERDSRPSAYVDLAALSGGSFEASLSSNTRGQVRRSRRLYEERSGAITIDLAESLVQAQGFLDELARLHNSRWQSKGEEGSFSSPSVMDFHRRLIDRLWPVAGVDLIRVRAGETHLGYLHNFKAQGKVYFFQSGFAYDADAKLKPGMLTHTLAIEHYARNGLREYDFLAGDAQYKRSLAKQHRTINWTVAYRNRMWVRFILWVRARMHSRSGD
jgi:Acetyltransferase (GNAT) domain